MLSRLSALKQDFSAGFIVFLIALPLCVGISIASGAPPTAGIITAIVGGIVGSFITGSHVTINGPAAGMIVVVLACIDELGRGNPMAGYQLMLACTVVAGALQIIMGLMKVGTLGFAFPSTVVHAMLSAIGLIIISKQTHVLMGVDPHAKGPIGLFLEIPSSFTTAHAVIFFIGAASLATLIAVNHFKPRALKFLPAPLLAVLVGVTLGYVFDLEHEHTVKGFWLSDNIGPKYLLSIPSNIASAIAFPDFSQVFSLTSIKHIFMITFIASTESILSAFAVDKMDKQERKTDMNKELRGKGVCNLIAGSIGGLPMIAEIVRSTANINNGAKTQWSNFFHGAFILMFIGLFPQLLHHIPLASLAAVLIYVGYQLAKPSHFLHAHGKGWDQGLVYGVTVMAILFTDLLVGVAAGAVVEFAIVAYRSRTLNLFSLKAIHEESDDKHVTLRVDSSLAFTNYLSLRRKIENHNMGRKLTIDMRDVRVIDPTTMEHLNNHVADFNKRGSLLDLRFSHAHRAVSKDPFSSRVLRQQDVEVTNEQPVGN